MSRFDSYVQGTPNWLELNSTDQRASARFYADLLGWELEENPMDEQGGVYIIGRIEGDAVAAVAAMMPGMGDHPSFWTVYLAVDDVDAAAGKVEAAGGTVEAAPFDVMDEGRMAAVVDPTGARVNLWQAKTNPGIGRANENGTLVWNELVTPDLEKALPFYETVLGMTAKKMDMEGEPADAPPYFVLANAGGADCAGACPPPMEGLPPHWNLYFQVADADEVAASVPELGGGVMAAPFDIPGVGRIGVFTDPQGAVFNVMAPMPAA